MSMSGNGMSVDMFTIKTTSLLIPLLIRAGASLGPVQLTGIVGPYYTLALGDMKLTSSSSMGGGSAQEPWVGSFGAMGGAIVGFRLGPGALFADARYAYDFAESKTKEDKDGVYQKSAIQFGLGYAFQFGK
jgi:hypothetical protein